MNKKSNPSKITHKTVPLKVVNVSILTEDIHSNVLSFQAIKYDDNSM